MARSVFCVCPPGNTQDSARVWRSIILGCIPVTFFRWVPRAACFGPCIHAARGSCVANLAFAANMPVAVTAGNHLTSNLPDSDIVVGRKER